MAETITLNAQDVRIAIATLVGAVRGLCKTNTVDEAFRLELLRAVDVVSEAMERRTAS